MRGVSTISTSHVGVLQDKKKSSEEYGFPTQDTHTVLTNFQIYIHAERSIKSFQLEPQNLKKLKMIEKKDLKNYSEKSSLKQEVLSDFNVQ